MRDVRRRRAAVAAVAGAFLVASASLARAELVEHGDLFVKFSGGISPNALPRHAPAPISLRVGGVVKTLSGERPPALRKIVIQLNSGGHIDDRGLPVCPVEDIETTSNSQALAACGPALVGGGSYLARTAFPEQSSFPSRGRILAFNTVVNGHRAIAAHVYSGDPVPITRIVIFHIHSAGGAYGTALSGSLPATVNRYGYVEKIDLHLYRLFSFRGRTHSYLSAACAAPPGFPGAVFPFARASMVFADGRKLSSTLTRSCKVRG